MNKHASAGDRPSTQPREENTAGPNCGSDTRSLDQEDCAMRAFVATKAKQWGCTPTEAFVHLRDDRSIRRPHAEAPGPLQSLTLDLPTAQLEEVARLLPGAPGAAPTLKEAAEECLRQWLVAMITAHGDPFVAPSSQTGEGGQL